MRTALLLLSLALALPGVARAQNQVVIEARIQEVVGLDFDLGFKLPCPHAVEVTVANPTLLQPVGLPDTTRKQSFELQVLGFGVTNVTATFTGPGGDCAGMASDVLEVEVRPDLSGAVQEFEGAAKSHAKDVKTLLKERIAATGAAFEAILVDWRDEAISTNQAVFQLLQAHGSQKARMGDALGLSLQELSELGSDVLLLGGATVLPPDFQSGAEGGSWEAAKFASFDAYAAFASQSHSLLRDALDELEDEEGPLFRVNLTDGCGKPLLPIAGPALEAQLVSTTLVAPGWLTLGTWSGPEGSGIAGVAFGAKDGVTDAQVRFVGPSGADESFTLPLEEPAGGSTLLLIVTPTLIDEVTLSSLPAAPLAAAVPSGNWRVELRYEDDARGGAVAQVTVP
jgi:hypothetical protein